MTWKRCAVGLAVGAGVALAVACMWYGAVQSQLAGLFAGALILLDTILLANLGGVRAKVDLLGDPDPRVHVAAWAVLLTVTVGALFAQLALSPLPAAMGRACRERTLPGVLLLYCS